MNHSDDFLWIEKYRPQTVNDCILPKALKETFSAMVAGKSEMVHMLFHGTAGGGKTTVAKALCNELKLDYLIINASEEGNIDTLRGKIKQFASTVSLQGGYKVVILDESDYLTPAAQGGLRNFMETFANNCRFILTCNFVNRIIDPLQSRCSVYEFRIPNDEKPVLAMQFLKRLGQILNNENVTFDRKVLVTMIEKHFPDWRRIINECQRYSVTGNIDTGILESLSDESVTKLVASLKEKNFNAMRRWVVENVNMESTAVFRRLYDSMSDYVVPGSIPQLVLILADYSYKDGFMADKELNMVAAFTEVMANVEFK